MKNKLYIFCNDKIKNFLISILSNYELKFIKLNIIEEASQSVKAYIIFINKKEELDLINFKNLNNNYLIMSSLKNNNLSNNNVIKLLNAPLSIDHIRNSIDNFLQNLKIQFHDIFVDKDKLTNLNNNSFCYLTKVELEILSCLIKEKVTSKNFIKENILNIKSNIETNSLESHLTRIRKKMNRIKTAVKIQAKSEKLLITI